ncbi:hypothetical protein PTTG_10292 [Puccinia triticina 1-1 BBBD Race 1]|uniref:Uncharacterized protein n=1 Tax=Puccinia triticina (isolate 1-1 / race 1 (BBBD)) TaxID=630390 RepID=A0A180G727_PUCT1|nr:hypothetical protein PTTG_10292 [Puccinia triticina 1-1 BBBD Race 1]WAR62919.1 hypothetical protein PtB15_18B1 [Puccinia triticina]
MTATVPGLAIHPPKGTGNGPGRIAGPGPITPGGTACPDAQPEPAAIDGNTRHPDSPTGRSAIEETTRPSAQQETGIAPGTGEDPTTIVTGPGMRENTPAPAGDSSLPDRFTR